MTYNKVLTALICSIFIATSSTSFALFRLPVKTFGYALGATGGLAWANGVYIEQTGSAAHLSLSEVRKRLVSPISQMDIKNFLKKQRATGKINKLTLITPPAFGLLGALALPGYFFVPVFIGTATGYTYFRYLLDGPISGEPLRPEINALVKKIFKNASAQ